VLVRSFVLVLTTGSSRRDLLRVRRNDRELKDAVNEVDGRDPSLEAVGKVNRGERVLAFAGESQGEADGRRDRTYCFGKPEVALLSRDGLEAAAMDQRPDAGCEVVGALNTSDAVIGRQCSG
jgi:hypothetical protein